MDIFLTPENPFRSISQAEFYPDLDDNDDPFSRWDGGPFLTYPHRKTILHMIPLDLRHGNHPENGTTPFTEINNPTPRDLQHRIFTTWFFVGLLAEFLGANRQDDPDRPGDNPAADSILEGIYESCVTSGSEAENDSPSSPCSAPDPDPTQPADRSENKAEKNRKRYLTATIIPRLLEAVITTINLLPEGPPRQKRIDYLFKCLRLTAYSLTFVLGPYDKDKEKPFDPVLYTAISGLGELFSQHLFYSISITQTFGPGITTSPGWANSWKGDFLARGSLVREEMTKHGGWCISDLGRINSVYQRLFTVQYISLLDRHVKGRRGEHGDCTEDLCLSAQIDNKTYRLSHADEEGDCGCDEYEVDIEKVNEVLVNTESWPILVFEGVETEERKEAEVRLGVKEFMPGVDEYVALSHVSLAYHPISRTRSLLT